MERLTKREYGEISCTGREIPCSSFCNNCSQGTGNCEIVKRMVEKLADYEDLEEQGKLLKLPCKVGDTVYEVNADRNIISTLVVTRITIYPLSIQFNWKLVDGVYKNIAGFADFHIGEYIFLTKSEAEAKLKELRGK